MKITILFAVICVVGLGHVSAQEYAGPAGLGMVMLRRADGKLGYGKLRTGKEDKDAEIIIDYRFDTASEFSDEGYAVVSIAKKYGVIDRMGKTVVPIQYDYSSKH